MMEYPYIDYYKSSIDNRWHIVEHRGPDKNGTYTCKLLDKLKTEKEVKEWLKLRLLKGVKRDGK